MRKSAWEISTSYSGLSGPLYMVRTLTQMVVATALVPWIVACGDGGTGPPPEPPNRAPLAIGNIPQQTVHVGDSATLEIADYFEDPDGDLLVYAATTSNSEVATVSADGSQVTIASVAQGSTNVTVTATDPGGLSASQTFEVTVPNRAPLPVDSIPGVRFHKGDTATFNLAGYFTDPDGDTLTFEAESADEGIATAAVSGESLTVRAISQGAAEITVTARDPGELFAAQTFTATVPNRAPTVADSIPAVEMFTGDSLAIDLPAHFADPDGDTLTFEAESADEGVAAASLLEGTITLRATAQGTTEITVTARDPGELAAAQTFEVTVPNRGPLPADSIPGVRFHKGDTTTFNLAGYFTDPDGDTLTFGAESADEGIAAVAVSGESLTVRAISQGAAEITVTARDPGELYAAQTFTVTVPNRAPTVADSIPAVEMFTGDSLAIDLPAHFADPDGDTLTFEAESADEGVAAASLLEGTITLRATAQGTTEITVTARDPGELAAAQTFEVTVPNRGPLPADSIPGVRFHKGDTATFNLAGYFTDPDGDTLTFEAESADAEIAAVTVLGGVLTLRAIRQGATEITVTARDPGELATAQTFTATVPNRAPTVADSIPAVEMFTGDSLAIDLPAHFADPDGDTLTFEAESADEGVAAASLSEGTITLRATVQGTTEITVTARDPGELAAAQTFELTVPNRAPTVADSIPAVELSAGDSLAVDLPAHFTDPDGDTLTFEAESADEGIASATVSEGTLAIRAGTHGATVITITARDRGGLHAVAAFGVIVTNQPPVAGLPISTLVMLEDESRDIALWRHFGDPDGDLLAYTAESTSPRAVETSVSNGDLFVTALNPGTAVVTVTARDPGGLSVSHQFDVAVLDARDRNVLIVLYNAMGGPYWENSENWLTDLPLDRWHGVEVDAAGRVAGLDLSRNHLTGSIPAILGRLERLKRLHLGSNNLAGTIPPEIGLLAELETLDLADNDLTGVIPPELGDLARLEELKLRDCDIGGTIPSEFRGLINLRNLDLNRTGVTGSIPPELGSLTRLEDIRVFGARLTGTIPPELGNLRQLRYLILSRNNLTGLIPPELGNLGRLRELGLAGNRLTGPIPPELGRLGGLRIASFEGTRLSGPIPATLLALDLFSLRVRGTGLCVPGTEDFVAWLEDGPAVDVPVGGRLLFCNAADIDGLTALYEATRGEDWSNSQGWGDGVVLDRWHGVATDTLGRVETLDLSRNGLVGRFPSALGHSLGRMVRLRIGGNALTGPLPRSLATVPLRELHYADTGLCTPAEASFQAWLGAIPSHQGTGVECDLLSERDVLSALYRAAGGPEWTYSGNWGTDSSLGDWFGVEVDAEGRVISLNLRSNGLTGSIPEELGLLSHLEAIDLAQNGLRGPIPRSLAMLTNLVHLDLEQNHLTGSIPDEMGLLPHLQTLDLKYNGLSGSMPRSLAMATNLATLDLGWNGLTGSVPDELGLLRHLKILALTANEFSGPIPRSLARLTRLEHLVLAGNDLTGSIPPELGELGRLKSLGLGDNRLVGPIPSELGSLADLSILDLRGNQLTGSIPPEPYILL